MDKFGVIKEAAKLAAYGFVTFALVKITMAQASVTSAAFETITKK